MKFIAVLLLAIAIALCVGVTIGHSIDTTVQVKTFGISHHEGALGRAVPASSLGEQAAEHAFDESPVIANAKKLPSSKPATALNKLSGAFIQGVAR